MAISVTLIGAEVAVSNAYAAVVSQFSKVYPYATCPGGIVASGESEKTTFGPFPGVKVSVAHISSMPAAPVTAASADPDEPTVDEAPAVAHTSPGSLTLCFSGAEKVKLVTEAQRLSAALSGLVTYAKPATSWAGDVWQVHCNGSASVVFEAAAGLGLDCDFSIVE